MWKDDEPLGNLHTATMQNGESGGLATELFAGWRITEPEDEVHGRPSLSFQTKPTATTPFIFLTAKGEKPDLRAGMNLGADDYLTKPVMKDELLAAIRARFDRQ